MVIHSLDFSGPLPLTLSIEEIAGLLGRRTVTVRQNISRKPRLLPPVVCAGRLRFCITQVALSWLADPALRKPISLDLSTLPAVLTDDELASLLNVPPAKVKNWSRKGLDSVPPCSRHAARWATEEVFKWMVSKMNLRTLYPGAQILVPAPSFQLATSTTAMPKLLVSSTELPRQSLVEGLGVAAGRL